MPFIRITDAISYDAMERRTTHTIGRTFEICRASHVTKNLEYFCAELRPVMNLRLSVFLVRTTFAQDYCQFLVKWLARQFQTPLGTSLWTKGLKGFMCLFFMFRPILCQQSIDSILNATFSKCNFNLVWEYICLVYN